MADRIKGITIEIAGDTTNLSKALSGVNKEIYSTQSQLKDVERLLKLDPTNTTLLAQKQKLLAEQIGNTTTKLDTLKQAEQQLKSQGVDENSEQFMALQREIASTEISLNKLNSQQEETENALNGVGKASGNAKDGINEEKDSAEKSSKVHDALKGTLAAVATSFAAISTAAIAAASAATKALVSFTTGAAESADEINTLAKQTGLSTDKIQEYKFAADLVDVSIETLTGSMRRNILAMQNAANGSENYVNAYEQLGISVTDVDGNLRNSEEVYWEIINALGSLENETERDAIAMTLLGRSAQDLNPLIIAGADAMSELGQQAQDTGYVMDKETLDSFNNLNDQLDLLKNSTTAAKNGLGKVLLPTLTTLSTKGVSILNKFSKGVANADGDITSIASVLGEALQDAIEEIEAMMPNVLEIGKTVLFTLVNAIIDNLPSIVTAASSIVMELLGALVESLPTITEAALLLITTLVSGVIENLPLIIQAAMQMILTLITGINAMLPTLIESIIQVVLLIAQTLINNLPLLIDGVITIFTSLAKALIENIDLIIGAIPELVTALVNALLSNLPIMIKAFVELFNAMITATPQIVASLVKGIPAIVKGIASGLKNNFNPIVDAFKDGFTQAVNKVKEVWGNIAYWFRVNVWNPIGNVFKIMINGVIAGFEKFLNWIIDGLNGIGTPIIELAKFFDKNTKIDYINHVKFDRLPLLANGGIVSNGGQAIVGEAGAELLTVNQGQATVQPLNPNIPNNASAIFGNNYNPTINIEFTGSLSELARILEPNITMVADVRGGSL